MPRALPVSSAECRTYTRHYKECCRRWGEAQLPSEDAEPLLPLRQKKQGEWKVEFGRERPREPVLTAGEELRPYDVELARNLFSGRRAPGTDGRERKYCSRRRWLPARGL